ncbi:hypothetical protein DFH29DRAFT_993541 [Suillus ampliporus]|nr:hypothetical protein DFH29DRAFT_993541 [Suillus ampliporus]
MSLSIEQLLQNLQISGLPTSGSSTKSRRQVDIHRPPKQRYDQHYGYRVNRRYMLYLETKIETDPTAFHHPMSLARKWIKHTLQLPQFEFKYCIDPERRELDDEVEADEDYFDHKDDSEVEDEDEDDEFVIVVLSVCSDEPASFNARPTQEQMTLLTNLLGSTPQWWVSYKNM